MTWSTDLLEAKFRGTVFDCISTDDAFDKDLAQHKFPYQSGAEIEDMGRNPRTVSITAIFYGDDYEDRLKEFFNLLALPGAGEFVHPIFGSWPFAQVVRGSIHHDAENVDQAQVSFELIESTVNQPLFNERTPQQKAEAISQRAKAARSASGGLLKNLMTKLRQLQSKLTALRQALLGPLFELKAMAGEVLSMGMDLINYPLSFVNDLTSLASGVVNLGGFSIATVLSDYRHSIAQLTTALFTGSSVVRYGAGFSSTPVANLPRIDYEQPTEQQAIYAADLHVCVERVATIADAAAEALYLQADSPTLSPIEIESITNFARAEIDTVIAIARALYPPQQSLIIINPLKDTALALQEAAEALILLRPPLISRAVSSDMPLRLLAHHWYGDHTRFTELQRLNNLSNPNFLTTHQMLVAYAK